MPTKSKKKTRRAPARTATQKPAAAKKPAKRRRAKKTTVASLESATVAKIRAVTKKLERAVHRAKVLATK